MWQLILYTSRIDHRNVGGLKTYPAAFRKFERLSEKYPDRRYALRKVTE